MEFVTLIEKCPETIMREADKSVFIDKIKTLTLEIKNLSEAKMIEDIAMGKIVKELFENSRFRNYAISNEEVRNSIYVVRELETESWIKIGI